MKSRIWDLDLGDEIPESIYQYRVMSIKHLGELQADFENIDAEGNVSNNPVFRSYIQEKQHHLPESFPDAKSVIVMAVFTPLMTVDFHYQGKTHEILVPHYYDDGITEDQLKTTILNKIIGDNQYRIENAKMHVLLKRLAVRTGLGKYGRNNICYVEGMGSFLTLYAFFTNFSFEKDNWQDAELMESCKSCKVCLNKCPTGAISEDIFVIDVEKCIPLYNEVPGEFPDWINPSSHNALMGCLRCQLPCPANSAVAKKTQKLDSVSEEETKKILDGSSDEELYQSLSEKLRMFIPEHAYYYFPVITRNLRVLIQS
ncbi:MAG: 4Fe-4S double cluster binding domain-containing protein [Candidatus Thorarchaeota archaeon]